MKSLLIVLALLSGCTADGLSDAEAGAEVPAAAPPAAALDPAVLTTHRLGGSTLAEMQLLATPRGRERLAQLVSCALPLGASLITIDRAGTPYTFAGGLGLAPAWAERAPTAHERARIAACLRAGVPGAIRA